MINTLLTVVSKLFCWLITIAPWEQGLRIRAGKHVMVLRAGVHAVIPFVDRVTRVSIRRRISTIRPVTLTTLDGKSITLSGFLGYYVRDIQVLFNTLSNAEDTIEAEVLNYVSQYVASHTFVDCLPNLIEQSVSPQINLNQYGLGDASFTISNFAAVKTLRLITGDLTTWGKSNAKLETDGQFVAGGVPPPS